MAGIHVDAVLPLQASPAVTTVSQSQTFCPTPHLPHTYPTSTPRPPGSCEAQVVGTEAVVRRTEA